MNLSNFNLSAAQNELLNNLLNSIESEGRAIVEAPTGTGKTRVVIEALKILSSNKGLKRFLVVVPKKVMTINPWKKEFEKWWQNIKVTCVTGEFSRTTREKIYKEILKEETFVLVITAITLKNDTSMELINPNDFDVIVIDEAHHVVTTDEYNSYRLSIHYRQLVLSLSLSYNVKVIGLTLSSKTKKIEETEKSLKAIPVKSKKARAPYTRTKVLLIELKEAIIFDNFVKRWIKVYSNRLKNIIGNRVIWKIKPDNFKELLEKNQIPKEKQKRYISYYNKYRTLINARQEVWECLDSCAIKRLKDVGLLNDKDKIIQNCIFAISYWKLKYICNLIKKLTKENKKVLVYAKFRRAGRKLQAELRSYGIEARTFFGGQSPHNLKEAIETSNVIIATSVIKEGVDLPEFDVLIHISSHSNKFTRDQIRGRIRGGEEFYVVFKDTNDEEKLRMNVEEPAGILKEAYDDEFIKIPIHRIRYNEYVLILKNNTENGNSGFKIELPKSVFDELNSKFIDKKVIGYVGEEIVKLHFELNGNVVYKFKDLRKLKSFIGLTKEQNTFLRKLVDIIPPPFDLLVICKKPLLIDVKSSFKHDKPNEKIEKEFNIKTQTAISHGFLPTLTYVHFSRNEKGLIVKIINYGYTNGNTGVFSN